LVAVYGQPVDVSPLVTNKKSRDAAPKKVEKLLVHHQLVYQHHQRKYAYSVRIAKDLVSQHPRSTLLSSQRRTTYTAMCCRCAGSPLLTAAAALLLLLLLLPSSSSYTPCGGPARLQGTTRHTEARHVVICQGEEMSSCRLQVRCSMLLDEGPPSTVPVHVATTYCDGLVGHDILVCNPAGMAHMVHIPYVSAVHAKGVPRFYNVMHVMHCCPDSPAQPAAAHFLPGTLSSSSTPSCRLSTCPLFFNRPLP
jgi:hypothetical protein